MKKLIICLISFACYSNIVCSQTFTFTTNENINVEIAISDIQDTIFSEYITIENSSKEGIYLPVIWISETHFVIAENTFYSFIGARESLLGANLDGMILLKKLNSGEKLFLNKTVIKNNNLVMKYYFEFDYMMSNALIECNLNEGESINIEANCYVNKCKLFYSTYMVK